MSAAGVQAQIERINPLVQPDLEVWRLTNAPQFRDWIGYHNVEAWSPDGRYVAIERSTPFSYQSGSKWISDPRTKQIYLYDVASEALLFIGLGEGPRWATQNNWLFFVEYVADSPNEAAKVIRYDTTSQSRAVIATGFVRLDGVDSQDQWLYAKAAGGVATAAGDLFRLPLQGESGPENINLEVPNGRIILPNPRQPTVFYRNDTAGAFNGTRFYADLDGSNVRMAYPMLQRSHIAWSGDGTYLLQGHRMVFGRLWNEPFPSNLHILSIASSGDPSGCGADGRWVSTALNVGTMTISDLRSGDARNYLLAAGSFIHNSTGIDYSLGSYLMDNDAKCSPDGTKVVFASNYDLANGPRTRVQYHQPGSDTLQVESTAGFPPQGRLTIGREVVGYNGIQGNRFVGITRNMYRTTAESTGGLTGDMIEAFRNRTSMKAFLKDYPVTKEQVEQLKRVNAEVPTQIRGHVYSFDMRVIPPAQRGPASGWFADPGFPEPGSELAWQNQTDVYAALVRNPDAPYLLLQDGRLTLVPGEHHRETRGYYLLLDGVRLTPALLQPGDPLDIAAGGQVRAVAVEWSGLESGQSHPVTVQAGTPVDVLADKPADFDWSQDRWLVAGQEVTESEARAAAASVREIVHRYDGVIHRENWQYDELQMRDDLRDNGETIRRQYYADGRLLRREYHGRGRGLRTTERFDEQGYIYEVIQHNTNGSEKSRTRFDRGTPVEHTGGALLVYGSGSFRKEGYDWVRTTKK